MLTGERFNAALANRIGLIGKVVGVGKLDSTVGEIIDLLQARWTACPGAREGTDPAGDVP